MTKRTHDNVTHQTWIVTFRTLALEVWCAGVLLARAPWLMLCSWVFLPEGAATLGLHVNSCAGAGAGGAQDQLSEGDE